MDQSLNQCKTQLARLSVMGACAVLFMLGSAEAGFAQQTASPKPAASALVTSPAAAHAVSKPAVEEEETAKPAKAGGEGIKVHGHWKIVVKNQDGTVASSTEFENSLAAPGAGEQVLAELLSGQLAWGGMAILIGGNGMCSGTCVLEPGATLGTGPSGGSYANLAQHQQCSPSNALGICFPGLTNLATPANLSATPNTAALLTLQGSFTESSSETFVAVQTNFVGCLSTSPSTIPASACANYFSATGGTPPSGVSIVNSPFTQTSLATAINAVPGQVVTIVVTISFS
jgi:hypothetical protein